ncbi:MAG: hypothetical protein VKP62_04355 [Candidatus Sericytochromatia bacterium]|nr:hypothetical protein [Candidatus Sericytochromatia bacterium]
MTLTWLRGGLLSGLSLALLACYLPVSPLVRFSAFQVPYYRHDDFARPFSQWKAGRAVSWTLRYKATAHSDSELVIPHSGPASFGSQMTGSGGRGGQFTPTRAELVKLVDALLDSRVFELYDGHYGAYDMGGGLIGPEMRIEVAGILKHVSYDRDLPPAISWEAVALTQAAGAITALGLKYTTRSAAGTAGGAP